MTSLLNLRDFHRFSFSNLMGKLLPQYHKKIFDYIDYSAEHHVYKRLVTVRWICFLVLVELSWSVEAMNLGSVCYGPLTRYVKLWVAHAPGIPGTFSPPRVSDPDMHHDTCMVHVPWCMPGSLTNCFLWSRWRGKRSRHSRRMRNPQFYVIGKRSMTLTLIWYQHFSTGIFDPSNSREKKRDPH